MPRSLAKLFGAPRSNAVHYHEEAQQFSQLRASLSLSPDRMQTVKHWMRTPTARFLLAAAFVASAAAADWPDFRGPDRDGVSLESVSAAWPEDGPPVVWERAVGAGFANPVVANGRVILFHRRGGEEIVEALDAKTGADIWRFAYATAYHDDFGFDEGPRASPVVSGGQVYTYGAQGTLTCLSFATGKKIWQIQARERFASPKGFFGAATTPLVDGRRLYLNVGGAEGAGIVALDKDTGKLLWQATNDESSYSSPVTADFGDGPRVVFFTREGLVVLVPESGEIVFEKRWRARSHASVNAATPVVAGDLLVLTASYGTGALALRRNGAGFDELWSGEDSLTAHYATPVYDEGTLFGFHGRQEYGQSFRAVDAATGKVLWSQDRFGAGTVLLVGGRLLILTESGELILAAASRQAFEPLARAQILPETVRAYPAFADGKLYARDQKTLACLDLGAK